MSAAQHHTMARARRGVTAAVDAARCCVIGARSLTTPETRMKNTLYAFFFFFSEFGFAMSLSSRCELKTARYYRRVARRTFTIDVAVHIVIDYVVATTRSHATLCHACALWRWSAMFMRDVAVAGASMRERTDTITMFRRRASYARRVRLMIYSLAVDIDCH